MGTVALAGCLGDSSPDEESNGGAGDGEDDEGSRDLPEGYTGTPQIIDLSEQNFETTLRTESVRHEVIAAESSGGPVELPEVWAWQADDHEPSVPGPVYLVPEGEEFEIHYDNNHSRPHTVHTHGIKKSWKDDGAPSGGAQQVNPGDSHTYHYVADEPGTHAYHCHVQTDTHLDMGMYGILHVIPENRDPVDKEFFLNIRDWDSTIHESHVSDDVEYDPRERSSDTYTINGRSAPTSFHPVKGSPMVVEDGDTVRVHLVNAGYESHPYHQHNHRFEVVANDGSWIPESQRTRQDVVNVAPSKRITIQFEANSDPGIYPAHCHKVHHLTSSPR